MMLPILLSEGHIGVDEATKHADVDADAVQPREDVVTADEHSDVRNAYVLKASHDCRRQGRVVLRTENCTVVKHEAHNAGEDELKQEDRIRPLIIAYGFV